MKLLMISSLLYNENGETCWPVVIAAIVIVLYILAHIKSLTDVRKDKLGHEAEYYRTLAEKTNAECMSSQCDGIKDSLRILSLFIEIEVNSAMTERRYLHKAFDLMKLADHSKSIATNIKNSLSKDFFDRMMSLGLTESYIYDYIISEAYILLLQVYQTVNEEIVSATSTNEET